METLATIARSSVFRFALAAVVIVAVVVVGLDVTKGSSTYPLKAVYASAPGLFPGAKVDVLGVPVGTVTAVTNVRDHVDIEMQVNSGTKIPAAADASLVAPQVLGQPDVDLNPGYTGGPHLQSGATIPESRTSVPVSTDQLLKELQRTLKELNPKAVGDLISNLSQDLDGQGAALNQLIAGAAGTIQLLANKGDDLGQLNGTLAQLTGTLDSDTAQIEQLVTEYDTVSTVIAQHSGQLNDAIGQLSGATTALATLLTPNLAPLEADVGTVTTAGRTLDRNLSTVDEVLDQANNLFEGAQRAYDPNYNWLNLNLALPPGVTGAYEVGLVRDTLAGICRRLYANHASGLSAAVLAQLESCGDPNSTFFNPLISEIPTILNSLTGSGSTSATALLQQGLNVIGGIAGNPPPAGTSGSTASSSTASSSTASPSKSPTSSTTTTTTVPAKSVCSLLGALLGCKGGTSSSSNNAADSTSSVGGLVSERTSTATIPSSNVYTASSVAAGPSLTAPAAALLPQPSRSHHAKRAHRGLLAQWAHDIGSWL
jgi:phospholipid/cholesterol/gamma-HCH transport system substrate-binding protein